ncbi:hypothetical protein [Methylocaldum sp.]|uniref:hypothetical protein n=1 Tax=Methylocaldum sp. TaxID=1969727 RepID=UPI002D44F345|nr:hypothetical protein [Methylocaldum sp.]HYE37174.1 hypothetical protein [Methylocaldum sp.]
MKVELGWADFMVRSDRAIRRHWALVCCAFSFCWWHEADVNASIPHAASPASCQARPTTGGERKKISASPPPLGRWPQALRRVRAWLAPVAMAHPLLARGGAAIPHRPNSRHCWPPSPSDTVCTSTSRINKLPVIRRHKR